MTQVEDVIESLELLLEDEDLPQSVEQKLNSIIHDLRESEEISLVVNKAQNELEDLSEDVNIPPFVRTQLWGILSKLAALESRLVEAQ